MMLAGAPSLAQSRDNQGAPPALDCSSSPTNASASSTDSSTRSGPAMTSAELASIFLKQNLMKQDLPQYNMFADPAALLTLTQLLSGQAAAGGAAPSAALPTPASQPSATPQSAASGGGPTTNAPRTATKRPYPCSFQYCVLCQKDVHSSKLPCHIRQCHVAKPMFQCPACDFTSTYSKNNVKSHMVSLHGLAGDPISYMDQYASQVEEFMKICFPNVRGRGRPMHGRNSPISPSSPQARRNSQGMYSLGRRPSIPAEQQQQMMQAAVAMQQARQVEQAAAHFYGLNPLFFSAPPLIPPAGIPKSPAPLFMGTGNNNNMLDYRLLGLRPNLLQPKTEPGVKTENGGGGSGSAGGESTASAAASTEDTAASQSSGTNPLVSPSFTPRLQRTLTSKYIEYPSLLVALAEEDCVGTVFGGSNVAPMMEKLDLALFDGVVSPQSNSLLPSSVVEKVAALQSDENFKLYEVLFALHRLSSHVLSPEILERLSELAPSEIDAKRIRQYEENNGNLSDEEHLIVQLAKVERLEEKLFVLRHMSTYKRQVDDLLASIGMVTQSARALRSSPELTQFAHFFLLMGNVINGDYNADLVHGFRLTDLHELGSFHLPDGRSLLSLVAAVIRKCFPEMKCVVGELVHLIEPLVNVNFTSLLHRVHLLHEGNMRVERELRASSASSPEFSLLAQPSMAFLQEQTAGAMDQLQSLLDFMCEPRNLPANTFQPDLPLGRLLQFVQSLQSELTDVDVVKNEVDDVTADTPSSDG